MQRQSSSSDSTAHSIMSLFSSFPFSCCPREGPAEIFQLCGGGRGALVQWQALLQGWRLWRGCLTGGIPAPEGLVFVWVVVTAVVFCFVFRSAVYCYNTTRQHGSCLKKKNKLFFPLLLRSKRQSKSSKVEVKRGVQRYEPPGLRYMGKPLSPPSLLSHHPSELCSIQVSWLQIWLVSRETMPLFWCWQTSASLII